MLSGRRAWLAAAAALPLAGCGWLARSQGSAGQAGSTPKAGPARWARVAWRYVENNTDYDTGLVNGQDRSPVFTAWNAADALAAVVCARELGVIDVREFDLRLSRLLGFLATMDLSGGVLPNKAYHSASGKMVGFDGQPADIGWSAIDIGRLLLWLQIVAQRHPTYAEHVDQVVLRWSFCAVIDDCGTLYGAARQGGQVQRYQEGRLGYEQLAAAGYAAWGFDTRESGSWSRAQVADVEGIPIRHDARDPRATGTASAVLTQPYVLFGVELGWHAPGSDAKVQALADAVFRAQETRWQREHQLTARSDWQSRQPPYVVLDAVFANGYAWNTVAADGQEYPALALVSTRAAFGMAALWPGEYTQRLVESVQWLHDPDRGWYEGRREQGGAPVANITLSTNAAVLETLLFREQGALWRPLPPRSGLFAQRTADPLTRFHHCTAPERPACR